MFMKCVFAVTRADICHQLKANHNTTREIHLSFDGTLEKDRFVVAEYLSEYFSSMAKGIGGD